MRHPRRPLAARRKACGLTQEELAYAVGVDRSTVLRWEAGAVEPQPWVRRKLAAALGLSLDGLAPLLESPGTADATSAASAVQRPAPIPETRAIDLDLLEVQLGGIAGRYETLPSASLLAEAGRCHAGLTFALGQGGTERFRRRVHRLATVSATLLSQLVWDASGRRDNEAALAYCAEAADHAAACGDALAAARVELRRTYVVLYGVTTTRDPTAALVSAQTAAAQSAPLSPALSGLAQLHAAEALALQGEYRRCEQALGAAETCFSQLSADDPAADTYASSQYDRLAGSCYLALGTPERAEPLLSRTAEALRERHKTRSLVLGNLALSHLRQRELDAATTTLHEAIDLLEGSRGGGGMSVVFGAARELYPWRLEPAVQDVHDRLFGLMARG
jgi:transcriptional regulator with XRE-family HTH domain